LPRIQNSQNPHNRHNPRHSRLIVFDCGMKSKILVSACLLGNKVRYDANDVPTISNLLDEWNCDGRLIAFCPEVAGGLSVPRLPAEIQSDDGNAVLDGTAKVYDNQGNDVSENFINGAKKALEAAQSNGVKVAILKSKSPSCGSSFIYDGTFSSVQKVGQGVTTALLERNGIKVFSDLEIEEAAELLGELDTEKR
jgi:uncharacterized protein YbbK (DUF523 family)